MLHFFSAIGEKSVTRTSQKRWRTSRSACRWKRGEGRAFAPLGNSCLGNNDSGAGLAQVIRRLLLRLLCLGLGVGVRRKPFDRLAHAHCPAARYFCLERVEAARDVQVLRHVRCCNALTEVLESAACSLRLLYRPLLVLSGCLRCTVDNLGR